MIEDAAQALGATFGGKGAGSFGLAGCFSFYPFKVLGGFGDGGAITTNDERVARMAILLRYNGEDRATGEYHYHGHTALLDNVKAAVLDVKLKHLPGWLAHRRHTAGLYRQGLIGIGDLRLPHFDETQGRDIYQNYVIRTAHRDPLRGYLREQGVETLVHWPKPMWSIERCGSVRRICRRRKRCAGKYLALPMSAETTAEHVKITVEAIRRFFSRHI